MPAIGDPIDTCIFLAPIGSIPPPIDIDEDGLAIGIELDDSGIGDMLWLAAADGWPDEHAAAASASAATPAALRTTGPGRTLPGEVDLDIDGPPKGPAPSKRHGQTAPGTPLKDAR